MQSCLVGCACGISVIHWESEMVDLLLSCDLPGAHWIVEQIFDDRWMLHEVRTTLGWRPHIPSGGMDLVKHMATGPKN